MNQEELVRAIRKAAIEIWEARQSAKEEHLQQQVGRCLEETLEFMIDRLQQLKDSAKINLTHDFVVQTIVDVDFAEVNKEKLLERLHALFPVHEGDQHRWAFRFKEDGGLMQLVMAISFSSVLTAGQGKQPTLFNQHDPSHCREAAKNGDFERLKELRGRGAVWTKDALIEAARHDDPKVIEWMLREGLVWDNKVVDAAIEAGGKKIWNWAKEKFDYTPELEASRQNLFLLQSVMRNDATSIDLLTQSGSKTMVWREAAMTAIDRLADDEAKKILMLVFPFISTLHEMDMIASALEKGKWNSFLYLLSRLGSLCTSTKVHMIHAAMRSGIVDNLKSLMFKFQSEMPNVKLWFWDANCCEAAKSNSLPMFEYVTTCGLFQFDKEFCLQAAIGSGATHIVKFMIEEHGLTLPKNFLSSSVTFGHLPLLQWAAKEKPEWVGSTLTANEVKSIVRNGHKAIVDWVFENKIQFDINSNLAILAASSGDTKLLQSMLERFGDKMRDYAEDMFERTAESEKIEAVKWLMDNDFGPSDRVGKAAVRRGHYELLKWAIDNKLPIADACVTLAIEQGELDCLKLLVCNGGIIYEWHLVRAFAWKRWALAKWLIDRGCRVRTRALPSDPSVSVFPFKNLAEVLGPHYKRLFPQ